MLSDYKETEPIIYKQLKNSKKNLSHAYLFNLNGNVYAMDMIMSFIKEILCHEHKSKEEYGISRLENFIKNCISKNYVLKINEYPIRNMVLLSWQNDNVEDAENDKAFDSVEFTWHMCIKETKITGKDNNLHIK